MRVSLYDPNLHLDSALACCRAAWRSAPLTKTERTKMAPYFRKQFNNGDLEAELGDSITHPDTIRVWVATGEADHTVAAFLRVVYYPDENDVEASHCMILPEYQGTKLGLQLAAEMEQFIAEKGATKLWCFCLSANKKAVKAYINYGLDIVLTAPWEECGGLPYYHMEKAIDQNRGPVKKRKAKK